MALLGVGCAGAGSASDPDAAIDDGTGGTPTGDPSGTGGVVGDGGHAGVGGVSGGAGAIGTGGTVSGSGGAAGAGGAMGLGGHMATGGATGTGGRGTGGSSGVGGASGGLGGRAGTLRIMPLGDSTTGSVCYRAMLWQMLNQGGLTGRFDFVGSRHNDAGCGVTGYDLDNEGHPSVLVTDFINDADNLVGGIQTPQALLGQNPADVVLLHFATNDVWNSRTPAQILTAYTTVLGALRAANPKVIVLAAKLIPLVPINTTGCPNCACPTACDQRMVVLNDMIPGWATANATVASPIMVVDQHTGFVSTADTIDGVHPNASGSTKIAAKWLAALRPLF
jgi:lysophospholipase L1-like esterase